MSFVYKHHGKSVEQTYVKVDPHLRVRIPYNGTAKQKQPLHDALVDAAEAAGVTPLQVAVITNHFLEQVGEQVIKGRIVRIPGFGIFGAMTRFRYVRGPKAGDRRVCYPAFYGSNALKTEVRMRVRPALRPETDAMRQLHNNNRVTSRTLPESMLDVRKQFYNYNRGQRTIKKETRVVRQDAQAI